MFNDSPTEISRPVINLTIQHSMIKEKATFRDIVAPPQSVTWIKGELGEVLNHRWYEVIRPSAIETGISRLSSITYYPPDEVSARFRNRLRKSVFGKRRSWIWRPTDAPHAAGICQGRNLPSRDCLLFAFFELDFEDFSQQRSPLLREIKKIATLPTVFTTPRSEHSKTKASKTKT